MKSWLVGCTVAAIVGAGLFLAPKKMPVQSPLPAAPVAPNAVAATIPTPPAPPVVILDRVVETADIDSLLDPPAIPRAEARTVHEPTLIQVGFDEPAPSNPPGSFVPFIPKSAPDEPLFWFGCTWLSGGN